MMGSPKRKEGAFLGNYIRPVLLTYIPAIAPEDRLLLWVDPLLPGSATLEGWAVSEGAAELVGVWFGL